MPAKLQSSATIGSEAELRLAADSVEETTHIEKR